MNAGIVSDRQSCRFPIQDATSWSVDWFILVGFSRLVCGWGSVGWLIDFIGPLAGWLHGDPGLSIPTASNLRANIAGVWSH